MQKSKLQKIKDLINMNVEILTGDFVSDFDFMIKRVFIDKKPTAFARYNEWEFWLITKSWFIWAGWLWKTYDDKLQLSEALRDCLYNIDSNYFYWISSNQYIQANQFYKHTILNKKNITFATLFINYNYRRRKKIIPLISERVVLVANLKWENKKYPFRISEYVSVPFDVVNYYEYHKDTIHNQCKRLAEKYNNKLFLFSAWPLSDRMIDCMYHYNPNNRYIDVWSTLDPYIYWTITRQYFQENQKNYNRIDVL